MALVFVVGVASGLLMPFAFGANRARFSAYTGEIFGSFLAIESITAFSIESVFLGILLFGRQRVSKGLYWVSAFLVFLGSVGMLHSMAIFTMISLVVIISYTIVVYRLFKGKVPEHIHGY